MKTLSLSRRQFLKGTGALVVSFNLFPRSSVLGQSNVEPHSDADPTQLDSWLAIAADGTVTVYSGKVDLGTGVETALAQIVAEELDVPFNKVHMSSLDTSKAIDQGITAGSRTIERGGPQLRQAAAAARQQLLKLAAAKLNSTPDRLTVKDGVVSDGKSTVSYAQLIGGKQFNLKITAEGTGWNMKVAPQVRAKDVKDYRIVGTSQKRLELPPKLTGEFVYAHDVRVPGMLHGRVVRPPTITSKPTNIDDSAAKSIPGFVKTVQEGSFVGIVCQTEWAAIKAARALKVTWSQAAKMPASYDELFDYIKNTKALREQVTTNRGNPEQALKQASKTYEATYRWPFQLHGMMGPSCVVADVKPDQVTLYTGTQGSFETRTAVAELLGLPENKVRVLWREASGSYGRLGADDAAEDAALLSRAVGKPVRVQWMRDDEHAWEPKGPAQLGLARAGVDAQGKVIAWEFADRGFPLTAASGRGLRLLASRQLGMKATSDGNSNGTQGVGDMYTFENQKGSAPLVPWILPSDETPLRTGYLRAPGDIARCFGSECFMDEIAADQKVDPVQFRLRYLGDNKRGIDALMAVVKQARWQERPSPAPTSTGNKATGRGVSISNRAGAICGAVAEVEVDKTTGKVSVKRFLLSHDCGLVINPDGLKNQIEGNIIQGVSRTLMEEVKFDATGIKTLDWNTYPILRFPDVPEIEIVLINRPEMPALGGGEPSSAPIAAAIANAIFDAVGVRLREAPFLPERVLAGLKKT